MKKEQFTLYYNPKNKILYQTWIGFMDSEKFKKCCDEILSTCKKHDVIGYISDSKKQSIVPKEGIEYAIKISDEIKKCGVEFEAHVKPDNPFGKLSVLEYYEQKNINGGTINIFNTIQQAEDWINSSRKDLL
ncbi:hypothetical protein [Aureibacter tunicatorum]|uniref:Uncharacterized protein n=1 Tax=Aureibacter tunicatorum TaxID=866807 RepID=A0AAE3XPN6_9BACT|nr:hypothetical protein [Aureibacter tunicatorum]MDR6240842.1 hypothetical protein [Aureibacter tunicatorum]